MEVIFINQPIRQIKIGKEMDFVYTVGSGGVTNIVRDKGKLLKFGISSYIVYKKDEEGELYAWKEFENMPVAVEYFKPE